MKLYLSFNNNLNFKEEKIKAHELVFKTFEIDQNNIIFNEKGKPYIKNNSFYFSLSHSKGNIGFIKSKEEIGLDIEKVRELKNIELMKKKIMNERDYSIYNNPTSFDLLTIWTIKESYLKYLGIGLVLDPVNIIIDYKNHTVTYKNYQTVNYINNYTNDIIYTVTNVNEEMEYEIL